jgi:hypothetical protein
MSKHNVLIVLVIAALAMMLPSSLKQLTAVVLAVVLVIFLVGLHEITTTMEHLSSLRN